MMRGSPRDSAQTERSPGKSEISVGATVPLVMPNIPEKMSLSEKMDLHRSIRSGCLTHLQNATEAFMASRSGLDQRMGIKLIQH
jgi:hypothetical protein